MIFKKKLSIIYFILLSYLVFGIRVFPKMVGIHKGYNLNIIEIYSDAEYVYHGNNIVKYIDFWGNIAMFVPFAFCTRELFHLRKGWKLLLAGILCSITIETIQYIFKIGFADINDVLTNTIGTLTGIFLMHRLDKLHKRKTTLKKDISNN